MTDNLRKRRISEKTWHKATESEGSSRMHDYHLPDNDSIYVCEFYLDGYLYRAVSYFTGRLEPSEVCGHFKYNLARLK